MPCYYTGSREGDVVLAAEESAADAEVAVKAARRNRRALTTVTRLLCMVCSQIENTVHGVIITDNPALRKWWVEHKRVDAARKARVLKQKRKKK
jgi:hypothetical protein